jgi:hypothetical protein
MALGGHHGLTKVRLAPEAAIAAAAACAPSTCSICLRLRALRGISVGLLRSLIGIHRSLALSALATMIVAGGLLAIQ